MVRRSLPLLLLLFVCLPPAYAARLSVAEVRDHSADIIRGTVLDEQVRVDGTMVWTDYTVEIDEVLRGTAREERMTISIGGGNAPERPMIVAGAPRLTVGETYVLFLAARGEKPLLVPTVGWGEGVFHVVRGEDGETLISADGERLEVAGGQLVTSPPAARGRRRAAAQPIARNADGTEARRSPAAVRTAAASDSRRPATVADLRAMVGVAR